MHVGDGPFDIDPFIFSPQMGIWVVANGVENRSRRR